MHFNHDQEPSKLLLNHTGVSKEELRWASKLDSKEDVNEALFCPFRKVRHAYFWLFCWSPDYNQKKKSSMVAKWIKLSGLSMKFFTRSCIKAIVSSFAHFLDIDDLTYVMNSLQSARARVELDVSKPVPPRVWTAAGDHSLFKAVVEGGSCLLHEKQNSWSWYRLL